MTEHLRKKSFVSWVSCASRFPEIADTISAAVFALTGTPDNIHRAEVGSHIMAARRVRHSNEFTSIAASQLASARALRVEGPKRYKKFSMDYMHIRQTLSNFRSYRKLW